MNHHHGCDLSRASAGEIHELSEELASTDANRRKEAVKKVIAAMTVGKDVSSLFASVVNCIQTPNIEVRDLLFQLTLPAYSPTLTVSTHRF